MFDRQFGFEEVHDKPRLDPNQDPLLSIYEQVANKPYFYGDEAGLYHPLLHQVVKMRSNGMIDIFTARNTGIRIDPKTQSVNHFANHQKFHINEMSAWVTGNVNEYVKGTHTIKAGKKVVTIANDNIEIKTGKNMVIEISGDETIRIKGDAKIEVNGNLDAKVKEHATINVDKTASMHGQNIRIRATNDLSLDGNRILIGLSQPDDHNAARWEDYYVYDEKGNREKRRRVAQSNKVWIG
jgi:hypothetical protein